MSDMSNAEYQKFLEELNGVPQDSPGFHGSSDHQSKRETPAPDKETPLDPEFAREEAKRLAAIEEEISALIPTDSNYYLRPNEIAIYISDISQQLNSWKVPVKGIGIGLVTFHRYLKNQTDQARFFGADTKASLDIDIHTDTKTLERAKLLVKGSMDYNDLGTRYIFDHNGKFGKLVFLPLVFNDSRRDIYEKSDSELIDKRKMVFSEMTAGDFELAGVALQSLKEQLTDLRHPPSDDSPAQPAS